MIRFLLKNEPIELHDPQPDLTVLDWLRLQKHQTGTKEGCGSGDCGACTVVIATPSDTDTGLPLSYTPANSCILMMGALHGVQLITVEHLGASNNLHPVQHALAVHHGSQCGFCTPGFVMSLFALFHQRFDADTRHTLLNDHEQRHALIEQYLGGNLCRCTGYRPIIAAAESILQQRMGEGIQDTFDEQASSVAATLRRYQQPDGAAISTSTSVHVPATLKTALQLWAQNPDAAIVAGGTDVGLEITQQLKTWPSAIHVKGIKELNALQHQDTELVVGASLSVAALLETLTLDFPDAIPMLLRFGSEQVRSQATVGGNLGTASPIGDLPPLLLALNASLDLVSLDATKDEVVTRNIPLADYFTGYRQTKRADNEWIQAVRIPLPGPSEHLRVYKISKRFDDDISSVCAALWVKLDTETPTENSVIQAARFGFGGMAATPKRATNTEAAVAQQSLGALLSREVSEALVNDFQPISDARASAQYRGVVAGNLLKRFAHALYTPEQPLEIHSVTAGANA